MGWDWGAIAGAALSGLSSMSSGSAARAQSKEDWRSRLEETRMQIAGQLALGQQARQYQLEDRKFNRDQIGNYRQFYTGEPSAPVAPIDTTVTSPTLPANLQLTSVSAPSTAKPRKKKKGFLSRLF